jgi:hypothetical protein
MATMEEIEEELQALYQRHGRLDPYDVVEAAQDPASPLHSRFTWDDDAAAMQWRLEQARALIRTVTIERIETVDAPARKIRAWVHDPAGGGYIATADVAKQPDVRDRVLDDMRRDLDRLRTKWKLYEETFLSLAADFLATEADRETTS